MPAKSTCQSNARVVQDAPSSGGGAGSLLDIRNLTVEFGSLNPPARAIEDVCLTVQHGEAVCLVGESGSGKSVTALSIARLFSSPPARYVQGEIWLDGHEILGSPEIALRRLRGRIVSCVFQEPSASLNPVRTIGSQILEVLKLHQPSLATREEIIRLLAMVGIPSPETRADDYPHQMSGGMQQRAAIAMAIAARPKLLVADEPTTALDVTVQAQIIDLMRELQGKLGMAILLITHNLGIVREIANRVAVIYAGQIVESAPCSELLRQPCHPYTAALIKAVPELGRRANRLHAIPGQVPSLFNRPKGCRFHPRCEFARPECKQSSPMLIPAGPGHWTRCPWHAELPLAPLSADSKA